MRFEVDDYVQVKGTLTAWEHKCGVVVDSGPYADSAAIAVMLEGQDKPIWFFKGCLIPAELPEGKLAEVLGEGYFA